MKPGISLAALAFGVSFALLGGWSAAGEADDKAGEVKIAPHWKAGEARTYERAKSRRRTSGGKETSNTGSHGTIEIEVVEAGDQGSLLKWTNGATRVDDARAAQDPTVREMSKLVENISLLLELDSSAAITGLRNWKELKDTSGTMIDAMMRKLQASGADARTVEATRATLTAMLSSKEQIEQLFLKEPQVFFAAIGRAFPPGRVVEYDDQLPNPLGGEPLPCKGKFELKSLDEATGRAVVSWTQTVDPETAQQVIARTLAKIADRIGREPPNANELKTLTIDDRSEIILDAKTGWVEEFSHTRTVKSENSSQEDTLSMKRIPQK